MLPRSKPNPGVLDFWAPRGSFISAWLNAPLAEPSSFPGFGLLRRAVDSIAYTAPPFLDRDLVRLSARNGTSRDFDRRFPADVRAGCVRAIRLGKCIVRSACLRP